MPMYDTVRYSTVVDILVLVLRITIMSSMQNFIITYKFSTNLLINDLVYQNLLIFTLHLKLKFLI